MTDTLESHELQINHPAHPPTGEDYVGAPKGSSLLERFDQANLPAPPNTTSSRPECHPALGRSHGLDHQLTGSSKF